MIQATEAEQRLKLAVDRALDSNQSEVLCQVADIVDLMEQLSRARHKLLEFDTDPEP